MEINSVFDVISLDTSWDFVTFGQFKRIFYRCESLGNVELLKAGHRDGPADMFLMWGCLMPEAERKYCTGGFSVLDPLDISPKGQLWLLCISAPRSPEHLAAALAWAVSVLSNSTGEIKSLRCLAPIAKGGAPQPVQILQKRGKHCVVEPIYVG